MSIMFPRLIWLDIGRRGEVGTRVINPEIEFKMEHKLDGKPDRGSFRVNGLEDSLLSVAQDDDAFFRVFAGHAGRIGLVMQGRPVRNGVDVNYLDPNVALTVKLQNARDTYTYAMLSFTDAGPTKLSKLIDRIITESGLARGEVRIPNDIDFPLGYTASGSLTAVLSKLADASGSEWFVRDSSLYWIPQDEATSEEAVILSYASGTLVNIIDNGKVFAVQARLEAAIKPGRRFVIEDDPRTNGSVPGVFKARDVLHEGALGGPLYDTTITARRLGALV